MKKNIKNNWYVITGAPSSGKTTVLQILEKKGYGVIYEQARIYIEQELKTGKTLKQIRRSEFLFQRKILELKVNIEKTLPKDKIIFFDRGIPDSIAYYKKCGIKEDKFLNKTVCNCNYKKIFVFELLPYQKDHARTETKKEVILLQQLLQESYQNLRAPVIKVPDMSKEERVNFILKNL